MSSVGLFVVVVVVGNLRIAVLFKNSNGCKPCKLQNCGNICVTVWMSANLANRKLHKMHSMNGNVLANIERLQFFLFQPKKKGINFLAKAVLVL